MAVPRVLRQIERDVLAMVQSIWGPQNSEDDVNFTDEGEAILWVRDRNGDAVMFMSLTNLAEWHQDGSLSAAELAEQVRGPLPPDA